ncbi:MAG: hypothetical protein JNM31_14665 [Flavobacteriales bacterium]|nr:hypothetical protein [Flavobacteriales bacterium]
MKKLIATTTFVLAFAFGQAQSVFRITNVTVAEKEQVNKGQDVTAVMSGDEGSDRVVIYTGNNVIVTAWVKVSTHNVKRSSVKDGAVNAIFEIMLTVDGKKDKRRVEKIFYAEQERKARFTEKFTIKRGIDVRVITVAFDGSLE